MSTIDHPNHYGGDTTYEAVKVIEAWELGFHLGNAAKYICRAGKKEDELEDLRKARWYLDRYIAQKEAMATTNKAENASTPCTEGPQSLREHVENLAWGVRA